MLENIFYESRFKKDVKRLTKSSRYDLAKLKAVIEILIQEKTLVLKYKNHVLSGIFKGYQECHIEPDWLLIYKINKKNKELILVRTGTHSELFKM